MINYSSMPLIRTSRNILIFIVIGLGFLFIFALPGIAVGSDEQTSFQAGFSTPMPDPPVSQTQPDLELQLTPSIMGTLEASITETELITQTDTPTPLATQLSFLPYIAHQIYVPTPTPSNTILFCDDLTSALSIPDNNVNGLNDTISINDGRYVADLRLYLDISHTWVGDLVVQLTHQDTGQTRLVLNRPGSPPLGCGNNDIVTILDDAAARPANDICSTYPHAISGIFLPIESLSAFAGGSIAGTWRLNVSDQYPNDVGALNHWCLATKLSDSIPQPTPPPTPVSLPASASISGMSGQDQQLELDCESRAAVDWAEHFGFSIGEIDFLNNLPRSNDPEAGFVGNPNGGWGNIPPNDYGVHAPPVAALLRNYGLPAQGFHSLTWDDLRAEIAGGDPAIVWIIGGSNYSLVNGTPHFYTSASTGLTTIVAPWEHTVILTGYTPTTVTILNGSQFVNIPLNQFLDSWSVLDFMAVLSHP